ncbi:N-acetylmuramic acid/N-acetylglucosamine kinase [Pullulanibacillus camelliae]|uniref:N-acetylmuramic acid/N-acetylglucosamine kinase n=2 Tax=Pullulanibacillus camelliae TaxID=1707096 RepID=A0A8J2YKC3_9BACL|nr:N-acetylmuramic acid/N-acetylglucosamine kinase [Pullulanibacillus camelliae]
MTKSYVAIDGGGTKTDIVWFNESGQMLQRVLGPSTNPNNLSEEELAERFQSLFLKLFREQSPTSIKHIFAGMAGADHPLLNGRIQNVLEKVIGDRAEHIQVENDAVNALWSGTDGKAGIVIIAGTGSILYGRSPDGQSFRIGGWGHLVSDEGSGYFIGREAIHYALEAYDGLQEKGLLYDAILKHFNSENMSDVIPIIYDHPQSTLAALVPIVERAAVNGDVVAHQIIEKAAHCLITLIHSGLDRFENRVPVVLAGGVWNVKLIMQTVTEAIAATFIRPEVPPIYGSIIGALGQQATNTQLDQIKRCLVMESVTEGFNL